MGPFNGFRSLPQFELAAGTLQGCVGPMFGCRNHWHLAEQSVSIVNQMLDHLPGLLGTFNRRAARNA